MKRSKPLSALILIALALLLSGAKSGNPTEVNKGSHTRTETKNKHAPSDPTSAIEQPNPSPTGDHRPPETYNYYGNFNYIPHNTPAEEGFWDTYRAAIAGISAILVALFTGALVITSRLQWKVGKQSADAATESSRVAALSLELTQRTQVQFNNVAFSVEDTVPTHMSYWLKNTGHSVAHIKTRDAKLVFSAKAPASLYDPQAPHPACGDPDIAAPGPDQSFGGVLSLEPDMVAVVSGGDSVVDRLWLHGYATYYDIFDKFHVTVWCHYWIPGVSFLQNPAGFIEPDDPGLNYAT